LAENVLNRLSEAGEIIDGIADIGQVSPDRKLYLPKTVDLQPGDRVAIIRIDGIWILRKVKAKTRI
jgi:hypothetical protein